MRQNASKPFVENEDQVLGLAQTAERFGVRPSEMIGIDDEVLAIDFDNVCNFRLILLEIDRQKRELAAMNGEDYDGGGRVRGKVTKDTQVW